jgi:hypothetical protein
MTDLILRGGRVIDPASGRDETGLWRGFDATGYPASAMLTTAEGHALSRMLAWSKRILAFGKRIAMLEARVAALEEALARQPADACPFCGERAMRMTDGGRLLGDQGKQWWEEVWTSEECSKTQVRPHRL